MPYKSLKRNIYERIIMSIIFLFLTLLFGWLAGYLLNSLNGHSNFSFLQALFLLLFSIISLYSAAMLFSALCLGWGKNNET